MLKSDRTSWVILDQLYNDYNHKKVYCAIILSTNAPEAIIPHYEAT